MPIIESDSTGHPPEISPTKRLKTLIPNSLSPPFSSKVKSIKTDEEEKHGDDDDSLSEQQLDTCGVCLSEEGMSIRGFIDSCNHYFCFVCIMEWAKVESRCPICKRRFSTIRRPTKLGVFPTDRIVSIPARDQVYCHDGNATIGPPNPYSEVTCSICSGAEDDNLLLLCDLCDSAAHSYCVGLGATVPEGDWFCQDCTLSRAEHSKTENNVNCEGHTSSSNTNADQATEANVSVFDIVRESSIHGPGRHSKVSSSSSLSPETTVTIVGHASNARTLQRCLNVHARITVMRENWDGFRRGSFRFAGQQQPSSSDQESTVQKDSCSSISSNRGSYDVDRAWKMMDVAVKAIGGRSGKRRTVDRASKLCSNKGDLLKEAGVSSELLMFESFKRHYSVGSSKNNDDNNAFQMLEKCKGRQGTKCMQNKSKSVQNNVEGFTIPSSGHQQLPYPRKVVLSTQVNHNHRNGENVTQKDSLGAKSNVVGHSDGSSRLIRPTTVASERDCVRQEFKTPLKEEEDVKNVLEHNEEMRKAENAKSDIQSLVKLNLKLLSRDKKLEVDTFKEVARHATHSILAACGFQQPKAAFRTFRRLTCNHVDENQKRSRSTLMPTSCRECFFGFVKDVVNTIISDRMGHSLV